MNDLEFEEKVDIDDLVLPTNKRITQMIEVTEDFDFGMESSPSSIHDMKMKSEALKLEMKEEISKLFDDFDMMCLQDYDQTRVTKVESLFEKYLKEQTCLFSYLKIDWRLKQVN